MKHPILTILLALCLYIPNSWATDICEDSLCNKPNYTIDASFKYCWSNGKVSADSLTSRIIGAHEYEIEPFFQDLIRTSKSAVKRSVNLNKMDYCCQTYYVKIDKDSVDDGRQQYEFGINVLSLNRYDKNLNSYLDILKQKEYSIIDVISEAPVGCIVFWDKNNFVIVYFYMFDDPKRILPLAKTFLSQEGVL